MKSLIVILAISLSLVSAELTFIDLTHVMDNTSLYFPANPPYNFSVAFKIKLPTTEVIANYFQTPEHFGTHMDAPRHFCPQGALVHEIPLNKLSGPGVVLDFTSQATANYDYLVTQQDVKDWEAQNGPIPQGAVVLFKFGWNKYWPVWEDAFKTENVQNFSSFHWPGLGIDASRYVAETRKVHAVGFDVPSGDHGQSSSKSVHINLLCDNAVIILENVGNLDAMPTTGSYVYIGALKLGNGGGTPVRLFATVDDDGDPSGVGETTPYKLHVFFLLCMTMLYSMKMF